jgi:hypothetical protein
VQVKASMRPVDRQDLSQHELKRCRAVARGNPWEVWEEHIIWWGADPNHMQPVQNDLLQRHRRWLFVDTESGVNPALCWEIGDDFDLPPSAARPFGSPAAVRSDDYFS